MVNLKNIALAATLFLGIGLTVPASASTVEAGAIIPGSYIVTLKSEVDAVKAKGHISWDKDVHKRRLTKRDHDKGVDKTYHSESGFQGYSGSFDASTLKEIKESPEVATIEPNRVWKISRVREERRIQKRDEIRQKNSTWGLAAISHRKTGSKIYIYDDYAGTNTYAYVIDTGVRTTHSEFGKRAKAAWTNWKGDNDDQDNHETHVAKKSTIMSVKVFQWGYSETSIILAGINRATNDIIKRDRTWRAVIKISIGGPKTAAIDQAINDASKKGVVTVVASDNGNTDAADSTPSSAESAIVVGAIDPDWYRAPYSNWGKAVDILAPGTAVISASHDSDTASIELHGTSHASPHVAGLVLYAMSVDEVAGVLNITKWLKKCATPKKIEGDLKKKVLLI